MLAHPTSWPLRGRERLLRSDRRPGPAMIPGVARVLLLLPSGTYKAPDFLAAADRLGVEVVVASETRQTLAGAMGDRALVVDLADPAAAVDAITGLAARRPLDAVVAVDDQGVMVAALAAEHSGLPANPPAAVARTRDKAAMRAAPVGARPPAASRPARRFAWSAPGRHVPRGQPGDDVAAAADEVGLPVRRQAAVAVGQPGRDPGRRPGGGRGGRRAGPGASWPRRPGPADGAAARRALRARRGGGGRGAAARRPAGGAGRLRQARPARRARTSRRRSTSRRPACRPPSQDRGRGGRCAGRRGAIGPARGAGPRRAADRRRGPAVACSSWPPARSAGCAPAPLRFGAGSAWRS